MRGENERWSVTVQETRVGAQSVLGHPHPGVILQKESIGKKGAFSWGNLTGDRATALTGSAENI